MDIRFVELRNSNPSLGPYERKTSYALQTGAYRAEVEKLLAETKVNGKASLGDYLAALKAGDAKRVQAIRAGYKPGELNEGAELTDLVFHLGDGTLLELDDLRTFRLDGYFETTFRALVVAKGNKSVDEPTNREPPLQPLTDAERASRATTRPGDLPGDLPDPVPAKK